MMRGLIDEFIKYAKEQFGCEVLLEDVAERDTFKSLFGASFIEQKAEEIFFCEGREESALYRNIVAKVNKVGIYFDEDIEILEDMNLAA